jgi:hypothetical protein
MSQSKYLQELQSIRQRYKEQSIYMDQVLAQLTVSLICSHFFCPIEFFHDKLNIFIGNLKFLQKANQKKANADDYLALLRKF